MYHNQQLIRNDIESYLIQDENKELVRFITCGNVDDGKSTLLGRLLYDSKLLYEDQLQSLSKDSKRKGKSDTELDMSFLLDGLESEREQGITIDVAYRYFSTKNRKFIIADTPGHVQYTRNMATGASTADLAIILIDAKNGMLEQTKRHSFIAKLLGIKHFILAINKMDLVDYDESIFDKIVSEYLTFASMIQIEDVSAVPLSALNGDNVVNKSKHMAWYNGETLMYYLESIDIKYDHNKHDFRFPVQYVNRPHKDFRGYCGTIASGEISIGDKIVVLPSYQRSRIKSIVTYDGELKTANYAQAVTLLLEDELDVSRGNGIVKEDNVPHLADMFQAQVVWMNEEPLEENKSYWLKVGTQVVEGIVTKFVYKKDMETLEEVPSNTFLMNEIGLVNFQVTSSIIFDEYERNRESGRFIIIDKYNNNTMGAGMIVSPIHFTDVNGNSTQKMGFFEKMLYHYVKKKFPHWRIEIEES